MLWASVNVFKRHCSGGGYGSRTAGAKLCSFTCSWSSISLKVDVVCVVCCLDVLIFIHCLQNDTSEWPSGEGFSDCDDAELSVADVAHRHTGKGEQGRCSGVMWMQGIPESNTSLWMHSGCILLWVWPFEMRNGLFVTAWSTCSSTRFSCILLFLGTALKCSLLKLNVSLDFAGTCACGSRRPCCLSLLATPLAIQLVMKTIFLWSFDLGNHRITSVHRCMLKVHETRVTWRHPFSCHCWFVLFLQLTSICTEGDSEYLPGWCGSVSSPLRNHFCSCSWWILTTVERESRYTQLSMVILIQVRLWD